MVLRKLSTDEHILTRHLYEEVFDEDSQSFVDYYYTEKTKDNEIYVIEEDGQIQAMLHLNPYILMVNEHMVPARYIVAVATRKEYRSRGYMRLLLTRAMEDMRKSGQPFCYLMPAAEAIYAPYDFRTVYKLEIQCATEEDIREVLLNDRRVSEVTEEDCAALSETANRMLAANYQVYALRSEAYYRRLLKEYSSDGARLFKYETDGRITDARPWFPWEEEDHVIMVRILDVKRMLELLNIPNGIDVTFDIIDPILKENSQTIRILGEKYKDDVNESGSDGVLSIAAFTDICFGARTAEEISEEEDVCITPKLKEALDAICPLKSICLNEAV